MKIIDKIKQSTSKEIADMVFKEWIEDACTEETKAVCEYNAHDCVGCIYVWLESEVQYTK